MNFPAVSPVKFALGTAGVWAVAGMFHGIRSAPEDSGRSEQLNRGLGVAGAFGIIGAAAAPIAYYGAKPAMRQAERSVKSWASKGKAGFSAEMAAARTANPNMSFLKGSAARGKALYNNFGSTTAFVAGGAALGAVLGGATSDDKVKGAARGAVIGAGAGFVAKQAIRAVSTYSRASTLGKQAGIAGLAVLASTTLFAGGRAMSSQPASMQYGETDAAGETQYSNSPIKDRLNSMNASGDLVFGLNNKRRG